MPRLSAARVDAPSIRRASTQMAILETDIAFKPDRLVLQLFGDSSFF